MILGGLVDGTGLSASEVDRFTATDAVFWWNAIMAYREEASKKE
ncbi:hypothetical protein [Mesorhizobium sp. 2RAF21]